MNKTELINKTISFVKETLHDADSSHDWFHIYRVRKNTQLILKTEDANPFICELTALLHDIADHKFHGGDETVGPKKARIFLTSLNIDNEIIDEIVKIIEHISFLGGHKKSDYFSQELAVVQDADRLDAMGAIGIAGTFAYGAYKKREIYNPEIKPNLNMSKEEYKNSTAPTINHFYEKLLLLKDKMNTETGKILAQKRHDFMKQYLSQFYSEWEGKS
ncbi:MAG: HD domain-containing protein [Bacteroidales bacterium]|nr:HD domain-containing protein [Bacteroidales bacterium]